MAARIYEVSMLRLSHYAGKVGIGTTNPGAYKLAVESTIGARYVTITLVESTTRARVLRVLRERWRKTSRMGIRNVGSPFIARSEKVSVRKGGGVVPRGARNW
jgi:hypothetical protein